MKKEEALEQIRKWDFLNEEEKEALETLIPELRESEDERMLRLITEGFKNYSRSASKWNNCPVDEIIAWLEKQKEQKPVDLSDMMVHKEPYIAPVPTPMVADEQKPAEWSEEDEKMKERIRSVVNECAFHNDALDVNGDYCEGDYAKLDAWLKSLPLNLKKKNEDVAKLCSKEWSVEDEDRIRQIERIAQQAGCTQKLQEEIHNWLKSLRPQPKPEWNESDKVNINLIISYLDSYIEEHNDTFGADECKGLKYWLKSLRPVKREWSEDERKILDSIIDDYEAAAKSFCGYDGKIGILRAIRDGEYGLPKKEWSEDERRLCNLIARCIALGKQKGLVNDDDEIACLDILKRKDRSLSKYYA